MKKYKKIIVTIFILAGVLFIINSRRVDKTTFFLMVYSEKRRIIKTCNAYRKLKLGKKKENLNFHFKEYTLDKICVDDIKVNEMAERAIKNFYKRNWKFVY